MDGCHDVGTCDSGTGECSNPVKADGASCSDNSSCTTGDSCQAGVCVAGAGVPCAALDGCHDVGTCDPTTGQCSNPPKPDGAKCSDNNSCTTSETCQAGVCVTGAPVPCTAPDECHEAGTCDQTSGACTNPAKPDGTKCAGGECTDGVCVADHTGGSSSSSSSSSGGTPTQAGGCGCGVADSSTGAWPSALLFALFALRRRPRRGERSAR